MSKLGLALRYDLAEVPVNGARTTGVRSMNLGDGDQVVDLQLVTDADTVSLITQRGAFKKMAAKEISVTTRARKGVQVLHALKSKPHEVVDFIKLADATAALEVITDRRRMHDILPAEHPLNNRYSNGSFVIDTESEGVPEILRLKPTILTLS
jgi:topoisomerase-4 subunit A